MLSKKSYVELTELEDECNQTLDNPSEFKIDVEYWENVLKRIKVKKAKAYLKDLGKEFLDGVKILPKKEKKIEKVEVRTDGNLSPRLLDAIPEEYEDDVVTAEDDSIELNIIRSNIITT
mmetsp:Transcript_32781/g.29651  ORF Transcript_32781/g.29651 Transcript_32781/m.29651 type:complete len:119 (+) Transcript_32781:173-529(+)